MDPPVGAAPGAAPSFSAPAVTVTGRKRVEMLLRVVEAGSVPSTVSTQAALPLPMLQWLSMRLALC